MSISLTTPERAVQPPVAKIVPAVTTVHGDTRTDNYFWLRNREDPDTIAYLEAENVYTKAEMEHTEAQQEKIYAEILSHIKQTDLTVPVKRDDYFYYTRTEEGKQYRIYCRKRGSPSAEEEAEEEMDAEEEILLDGNAMAEGRSYFQIGVFAPSPNHKLLAYSLDLTGDEVFTILVKDLESGKLLPVEIPNTSYSLEWAEDDATLFYTVLDEAKRPFKVFRYKLGDVAGIEVYHEPDRKFELEVSKTSSRAFLLIDCGSSLTTEVRYLSSSQPTGEFRLVLPRKPGVEYDVTHHRDLQNQADSLFIRMNDGGAKTFRVVEAPLADPANWTEVLAARPEVTVEGVTAFAGYLVFEERDRGISKVRIRKFDSADEHYDEHYIDFPEPVYCVMLTGNAEYETNLLRFTYTSLVTPASVFDYDIRTRQRELKKQQEVPGYDPQQYQTERIYAQAPDGVAVPISIVSRKGVARDGSTAMLLYGYGAYGIPIEPSFSPDRLSLLDRGLVYAIAHVRGGGDLGKPWHEEGRLLKKPNTFTDFIACAETLIAGRYTSPARLAIEGRSAGGLLTGACVNLRPDLFSVVLSGVPFVDALNSMLDASLPLTVGEFEEWGDPSEKAFYDCIKSYAPYENVRAQAYPVMLITAGLNDPRVSYWEPAKWAAKLRAMKTDKRRLLLKVNMGSGHFGSSGRYEYFKETAFNYAFLLDALGIRK